MAVRVTTAGEVDLLGRQELQQLAGVRHGPCVSIYLPTHRAGRETEDRIRLKNLLADAEQLVSTPILAAGHDLVEDSLFWRYQADGLAVFAAPGVFRAFRLPATLPEMVRVGDVFHLVPVLPLLAGDGTFFVLALSQKSVRLFEATRFTIAELDSPGMPRSMDEALAHEHPEKQLQVRSGPTTGSAGAAGLFHGHGGGDEDKKEALERYFRVVDRSLVRALGDQRSPLVLAAVDYYLPMYRSVSAYRPVLDEAVSGNPEGWPVKELHGRALAIVEPRFDQVRRRAWSTFALRQGTGRTASTVAEILVAAEQGRVESLLIADPEATVADAGRAHGGCGELDAVNAAAVQTLLKGGEVFVLEPESMPGGLAVAAVLRY